MNEVVKKYTKPEFLMCVMLLAIAASGMSIAVKRFNLYLKKDPLPLKKSLELLDQEQLAPYEIVKKLKITNNEIIEALGTKDYIQWAMKDSDLTIKDPGSNVLLFITYYKLPDRVPHVPEECYTGGGYQRKTSDAVEFLIDKPGFKKTVPGRCLVFEKAGSDFTTGRQAQSFPVVYFFRVNGKYGNSREDARIALNANIFEKCSYFSKIELVFNLKSTAPNKEQAVKASEKILSVILPILEKDYYPDWDKI